jgi:hypothetical protein
LSWQATAWVKSLTHHADGSPLSAREKLILFVLADYHHEERGCAWASVRRAAEDSLTSVSRFMDLITRMEKRGTIRIERREGKSNLYHFPALPRLFRKSEQSAKSSTAKSEQTVPILPPTLPTAAEIGTEYSVSSQETIPAASLPDLILWSIEESRKTGRPADELLAERKKIA